ncbi:MAG: HAMP domain-containing histidine kinase [Lachnospiraceae bacterium]|nr:HAMP domain-containing histidine kinase [Lachnospiraceae bacterium]
MSKKEMNRQIRRSYLRDRYIILCLYVLIIAVFFGVAALYDYVQVLRNMLYAVELTLFFGVLAALIDYRNYRARCCSLFLAVQKEEERTRDLPEAKNLPEVLYRQLLMEEEQEKRKLLTRYDEKQKDMADYYTMWTHQIKTPIAAMLLLLQGSEEMESGQEEADRQREREELFKIEQYAQMALYFARLDSASSDFLFKEYDVQEIVKQAVRKYSVLFLRSGLSFRMEEFELRAVTDEKWLCFVVEQVFSNALKYTQQGGIAIYGADAQGNPEEGKVSYLVIEDTGIGIRESDLPRIFERGFTGYNGRLDKKATGLGLYLCNQIISRMSHTIRVKSEPGVGTKVILGFVQEE